MVTPKGGGKQARDALTTARAFLKRGWKPVPVPHREKRPIGDRWQKQQITTANVAQHFDGQCMNIGVQLGHASGGLTDVDLDCEEAILLAQDLLPATDAIFGRDSKPCSHWLYVTDLCDTEQKAVIRYSEPKVLAGDLNNPAVLVELRIGAGDKGAHTVAPGSMHPNGEQISWEYEGEPAQVSGNHLKKRVGYLAAAALLVRHYPNAGSRHEAALVLGGVLARMLEMDADDIKRFVSAIADVAGDEEWEERGRSAAGAVDLLKRGQPTPGLPRMREVWGYEVADTVTAWLNIVGDHGASVSDADAERIDALAKLDPMEYDRQLKVAARQLGVRTKTLEREVAKRREELAPANTEMAFLQAPAPWAEPVDGDPLLTEICEVLRRHIILSESCCVAIALWCLHSHAHDAARHSPILFVSSPTKRCGKTNLLSTISMIVPKPLSATNVTPATIFRAIDRWRPTMLIDEMDTFISDKSELRGVLNSGHTRSQAYVIRCVGEDSLPKQFSTWTPKVFAAIGSMHPTLEDRSIMINLKRKLPSEEVSRIPKDRNAYLELQRKCARWGNDHLEALRKANPELPEMNDRARDNWEPLLAIAEACGGDWPARARDAALRLSGIDEDETLGIQLLQDLQWLFSLNNCEQLGHGLSSGDIATTLAQMEDRPWPEFSHGKPVTPRAIAKLLKPWKIFPKQVKVRGGKWGPNGYEPRQFKGVFRRYLPEAPQEASEVQNQ